MPLPKNKKRLEITLATEDIELLNSLSLRYNISKSNVIKQALKVLASKKKHIYTVTLFENEAKKEPKEEEITDEMIQLAKAKWINQ